MTELICPSDHKHGKSGTCYNSHKCRCRPCKDSRAEHARSVNRRKAYGTYDNGFMDVGPVREHILMLREFGIGRRRIATLAGVDDSIVDAILYARRGSAARPRPKRPSSRVARHNAEKILSVKPDISILANNAILPARGTHRRVQALTAIGWSNFKIADRLGVSRESFHAMMHRDHVSARMHRLVADVYEQLWNVEPPRVHAHDKQAYSRSVRRAAAAGWPAPLDWDDIDNDPEPPTLDEDNTLDEIAIELAISGESVHLNHAEKLEGLRRMHPKKWSNKLIAAHLGCEERTVLRLRDELGLPGWDQNEVIDRKAA